MLSRLGMMLVEAGIVTSDEVDAVIAEFGPGETDLAESLVALGKVPEEIVTEFLAEIYSVEPIYLNETPLDSSLAKVIPSSRPLYGVLTTKPPLEPTGTIRAFLVIWVFINPRISVRKSSGRSDQRIPPRATRPPRR